MSNRKPLPYIFGRMLLYLVLIGTSFLMIIPFYWSVGSSLKLEQNVFASPPQWWPNPLTFQSYINVLTRIPFLRYFTNSVIVAVITTLGHVFFDTLAAYAFAKLTFPGRDRIFFIMLLALMVPFQVKLDPTLPHHVVVALDGHLPCVNCSQPDQYIRHFHDAAVLEEYP